MTIRVALVEDDPMIRQSLAQLVAGTPGYQLCGDFPDAESALEKIPGLKPEVVLMDINLPKQSGIDCVRQLKAGCPEIQMVMLTVFDDSEDLFNSLSAGASGYLLKRTPPAKILEAIAEVHRGGAPMSPQIARMVVERFCPADIRRPRRIDLSPREEEILQLLTKGYRYKEIGTALGLSVETVHSHLRRIYDKLHVTSRTEAVVKFLQR
jgi:DNA-binding NarL/FixJ family response regulator